MCECIAAPVGKSKLVTGDMRSLGIKYFGKLSMRMHSADGSLDVTLTNVAYAPEARFLLFSLHEAIPRCNANMDAAGVHLLGSRLILSRGESGSYTKVT